MATWKGMWMFAWLAFGLAVLGITFLHGRVSGVDSLCRQMGYERSGNGDGGAWLCVKTVTFFPGKDR